MRPSRTHLYKRVCPSVRPSVRLSVCPLRLLENRSFRHFSAAMMSRIKSNTRKNVLRASLETISFHLSVHPSLPPKSIHAETQSGRIVASGLLYWYEVSEKVLTTGYTNTKYNKFCKVKIQDKSVKLRWDTFRKTYFDCRVRRNQQSNTHSGRSFGLLVQLTKTKTKT